MSSYCANNGKKASKYFYMCCVGNYANGDIEVSFFGLDKWAAIREAGRIVQEYNRNNTEKLHLLTEGLDPGWAAGDELSNYVEVRRYSLASGNAFYDDSRRHDKLFTQERSMYDVGDGRDRRNS